MSRALVDVATPFPAGPAGAVGPALAANPATRGSAWRRPGVVPRPAGAGRGRRRHPWLLPLIVWTLPGLFSALQYSVLCPNTTVTPAVFLRALTGSLLVWYGWAALTPVVWALGRRFPFERGRLGRRLALHLLFTVPIVLVHVGLVLLCGQWIFAETDWSRGALWLHYQQYLVAKLLPELALYGCVLGVDQFLRFEGRLREHETRLANLERELAQAQLQTLRAQLQPHFLFNTLNSIAVLARGGDRQAAVGMIGDLSELLRRSLAHGDAGRDNGAESPARAPADAAAGQMVPLREELEFSQRYLHIEQMRFQERLCVQLAVDPATLEARVPSFLLQPLVENAVRHGIGQTEAGGRIEIRSWLEDDQLCLEVSDNGPGLAAADPARPAAAACCPGRGGGGGGVGLANLRERLRRLYRPEQRYSFRVEDAVPTGVRVRLSLPFQPA